MTDAFHLEPPVLDEPVVTDAWPTPDDRPDLLPKRDESLWARMARLWDSWVRTWL